MDIHGFDLKYNLKIKNLNHNRRQMLAARHDNEWSLNFNGVDVCNGFNNVTSIKS